MIISFASGKGGVGKTMVAANIAVAAAQSGLSVVLADLDIGGADAHLIVGELGARRSLSDFLDRRVPALADVALPVTVEPRLRLISGTGETLRTANLNYSSKRRLGKHLRRLDADLVVIDIGAGTNFHALDFFLLGDRKVVVSTPEPTAVMDAYKFVKLASVRHVLSAFLARDEVSKTLAQKDFRSVEEILEVASGVSADSSDRVRQCIDQFAVSLLVNQCAPAAKLNVAKLAGVMRQFVGGRFHLMGLLPSDPAVARAVARCKPVMVDSPAAPVCVALRKIVDELIADEPSLAAVCSPERSHAGA